MGVLAVNTLKRALVGSEEGEKERGREKETEKREEHPKRCVDPRFSVGITKTEREKRR